MAKWNKTEHCLERSLRILRTSVWKGGGRTDHLFFFSLSRKDQTIGCSALFGFQKCNVRMVNSRGGTWETCLSSPLGRSSEELIFLRSIRTRNAFSDRS